MSILHFAGRGPWLHIEAGDDQPISTTHCVSCGQCAAVCTTGAITVKNDIGAAWRALHDPQKRVVIQIAPAVRVAIGEAYGLPAGEKMCSTSSSRHSRSWVRTKFTIRSSARTSRCARNRRNSSAVWKRAKISR